MLSFSPRRAARRGRTKAELRLAKDMAELSHSRLQANSALRLNFPKGMDHQSTFNCTIVPYEGPYKRGKFLFAFSIPSDYPFQPPIVRCTTKILHPNINWRTGEVALALLQEEWKPVLSINTVLFGLQLMLLEPNFHDECFSLNRECRSLYHRDPHEFFCMVEATLSGGYYYGALWPRNVVGDDDDSRSLGVRSHLYRRRDSSSDENVEGEELSHRRKRARHMNTKHTSKEALLSHKSDDDSSYNVNADMAHHELGTATPASKWDPKVHQIRNFGLKSVPVEQPSWGPYRQEEKKNHVKRLQEGEFASAAFSKKGVSRPTTGQPLAFAIDGRPSKMHPHAFAMGSPSTMHSRAPYIANFESLHLSQEMEDD